MRTLPIAEAVKQWRAARGLSQRALAERAAMSYPILARLELGQTDPRLSTLERLAEGLGVSLVDLIAGPSERPTISASPQDLRALRRGRREHARGHYVTLDRLLSTRSKRPTPRRKGRK